MSGTRQAARVRRTGLALVHEGEVVLPAPGSGALLDHATARGPAAVHYHFPVEVELVSGEGAVDLDRIAEHVLGRLSAGLDGVAEG